MRNIGFDVKTNTITSDDKGSNESITITFSNIILNKTIVKFKRGAYVEKILLDTNKVIVSDVMNISPYFYLNEVKIETNKNYTYTTKEGSSGGSGETIQNVYVDNEDVINQLGVIKNDLNTIKASETSTKDMLQNFIGSTNTNFTNVNNTLLQIKSLITDASAVADSILS